MSENLNASETLVQHPIELTVGLLILAVVVAGVWRLSQIREEYERLAKPIILKILLEEKPNLQDLSHRVDQMIKDSGKMTAFQVNILGPGPINILRAMDEVELLTLDESWKTQDRARWGKYKLLILTKRGRDYAESFLTSRRVT